ncbi:hypothetical protein [Hoylesella buccalis]|uniref:hypothetical protein n=1 Tax=Hoylesella buccalis TaxID=28127 RepID=UPI0011AF243B|nr:hypothetical protein [Hoylesella buccalis]
MAETRWGRAVPRMHNRELKVLMASLKKRSVCNIRTTYATVTRMNFLDNQRSYLWLIIHQPYFCLQIR